MFKPHFIRLLALAALLILTAPQPPASAALSDGLVSYWSFDCGPSDEVGSNHGTVYEAVHGSTNCKLGSCYYFDGYNDKITKSSPTGLPSGSSARTISLWARLNQLLFYHDHEIFSYGFDGNTQKCAIAIKDNGSQQTFFFWGWGADTVGAYGKSANTYYHIVYTYDGSAGRLYINGTLEGGPDTYTLGTIVTSIYFGCGEWGGDYIWGYIDEVGIWNRVLSGTEVTQLYNSGSGLNPLAEWSISNTVTCDGVTKNFSGKLRIKTGGLLEIKNNAVITVNDVWIEKSGEAVHIYQGKLQVQ